MIFREDVLKTLTRFVREEYDYPELVTTLEAAWNNEDGELHQRAWEALENYLGALSRDNLLMRTKQHCGVNDWLSQRV